MIDSRTCDSAPVTVAWRDGNDRYRVEKLLVGEIERKPILKEKNLRDARMLCIAGNVYLDPHKASTCTKCDTSYYQRWCTVRYLFFGYLWPGASKNLT